MKSKVNKILIGVVVLLVGAMGYLSYRYVVVLNEKPKCDDIVVDDKPSRDLIEDEVEPLYNILATFGDNRRPNQFFKNSKVLFKDLDDEFKNALVWQQLNPDEVNNATYSSLNDANKKDVNMYSSIDKFLEAEYGDYPTHYIYDINYDTLNIMYKRVFGLDKTLDLKEESFDTNTCFVRNNDLLCIAMDGGYIFGGGNMRFASASKSNDTIMIYTYDFILDDSVTIDTDDIETYLNNLPLNEYKKHARKYKSVFKEDYNGNYYWYSTEPVEE